MRCAGVTATVLGHFARQLFYAILLIMRPYPATD
jgi:hypothetical protein